MDYFKEREAKALKVLDEIRATLPPFCGRFFTGLAHNTSPLTRLGYAYDLRIFFEYLTNQVEGFTDKKIHDIVTSDLDLLETWQIEMYLEYLTVRTREDSLASAQPITNENQAKMRKLATLRSFFAYYFKNELISKNILPNVDMPKIKDKPIVRLEGEEIRDILLSAYEEYHALAGNDFNRRYISLRDYTILLFFLSTGIRISELVGLDIADINLKDGSFKITRKGGARAILFMPTDLRDQLPEYLEIYAETFGSSLNPQSPLWLGNKGTRLTTRAVQLLVKKHAEVATPLKKITPHKLRSTYGTQLYRDTKDIYLVADMLGHRDVNTTKKHYAALDEDIKRKAASEFQLIKNTKPDEE